MLRRFAAIRALCDMEARLAMIAPWPELKQVLTLALPSPEMVAPPEASPRLARLANESMARMRDARPDRFPAFVASLPMNNVAAALEEMDRAIVQLGARGVQVLTSVNGRPLDDVEFFPIFERLANRHALPLWLHPYRAPETADYPGELQSEYEIWTVLGWPHESSVAMARMVFSEMLERLPQLKVITHHCGATIPYLAGRVGPMWDEFGLRSGNPAHAAIRARMSKPPIEHFRGFFADTAIGGSTAALRCGLDFFGVDRLLFATDCPFGPEGGAWFLRENIRAVDELPVSAADRMKICSGSVIRLMRLGHTGESAL
jgi:aminocarboxymuconate-semialdehyde decarboxylase